MAASIPSQVRTVDPFASYNSDTVNKLTKMVTYDEEGLAKINDLRVTDALDATSTAVFISTGYAYKDQVLIDVTARGKVDFNTADHYYDWDSPGLGFNENGYYYIILNYTYVKSRPAPEASYQIVKPSQRGSYSPGGSWLFLAAVLISGVGGSGAQIDAIYDYDPTDTDNKREYAKTYVGTEQTLPTHDTTRDQSRFAYESATDTFWFGYRDRWTKVGTGVEVNIDTTGLSVGEICYTDSAGKAASAIATDINTGAEMAVASVGTEADRSGRALMSGLIEGGQVESGIIINVGDLLYLSNTEAGTVTNVRTTPARQIVGRAWTGGNSSIPIDMLFFPRDVLSIAISGTIEPGEWVGPDGDGLYYDNVDISALDVDATAPTVLVNVWDDADNKKVSPTEVEIIAAGNAVRIYTDDNSLTWNYVISTGGGSVGTTGGGGGTSDHSLLFNLDYASSGHTGFSPSPHNNTHHSATYIEATDVTFSNLNANGDVGAGGAQVAIGNHTHGGAGSSVPVGEIILFEKDTAVSGYSLLTTDDDSMVYITRGSAAGGETGGTAKASGTWSQPNHNHPFTSTHTHSAGSHTHAIGSHFHQWISTSSSWNSSGNPAAISYSSSSVLSGAAYTTRNFVGDSANILSNNYTGPGSGNTGSGSGSTGNGTASGNTSGNATTNAWRPQGRNFTRQQRI